MDFSGFVKNLKVRNGTWSTGNGYLMSGPNDFPQNAQQTLFKCFLFAAEKLIEVLVK